MKEKSPASVAAEELGGTVTALERGRGGAGLVRLYLDGEFALVVHPATAEAMGLAVGASVDGPMWQRLCMERNLRLAQDLARKYMARTDRSEAEVRSKLHGAGFTEAITEATVRVLRERGYLDDARLARQFVESRFRKRGYGPARLHAELRRRRIGDSEARQAVEELAVREDMLQAALNAAARRWRIRDRDPRSALASLARALGRLGYDTDTVRAVVDQYRENLEARHENSRGGR